MDSTQIRHEFENFFWFSNNIIGHGASCKVFSGQNKVTGAPVAVKEYHYGFKIDFNENRIKQVASQFDHDHILKIFAYGYLDPNTKNQAIIVTELCSEGDLEQHLATPKNKHGISDKEFFKLLICLKAALKEMREKNIVHRDIKPMNICCHSSEKEKCYKLIDLDGARMLEDGQITSSIVGTEEFCHPHMYRRYAFEGRHQTNGESTYIDLWSTGITLYKVATNRMPFRPYNYQRVNKAAKKTLHRMESEKAEGVIAAVEKHDGQIDWQTQLPKNISLSRSLAHLLTPILRRLLESEESKMWKFDQFFAACDAIKQRHCVCLFSARDGLLQKCYLPAISVPSIYEEYVRLWQPCAKGSSLLPDLPYDVAGTSVLPPLGNNGFMIFHNGHRLSALQNSQFHSLLHQRGFQEVFIVVDTENPMIEENEEFEIVNDLLPNLSSMTFTKLEYNYCDDKPMLQKYLHTLISQLWDYQRQMKLFWQACKCYHIAVDNLSHDLTQRMCNIATTAQQLLTLCRSVGSTDRLRELENLKELADTNSQPDMFQKRWFLMLQQAPARFNSKMSVRNMPRVAESLWLRTNDNEAALRGHIERVNTMLEEMKKIYDSERTYFFYLRSQFHNWMASEYSCKLDEIKLCDQCIALNFGKLCDHDASLRDSRLQPELNSPIITLEMSLLQVKAAELEKVLQRLKRWNELNK